MRGVTLVGVVYVLLFPLNVVKEVSPSPRNALPGYLLYALSSHGRVFGSFLSTLCEAYAETNASLITDYVSIDLVALEGLRAIEGIRYEGTSPERTVTAFLCVHCSMRSRIPFSSVSTTLFSPRH